MLLVAILAMIGGRTANAAPAESPSRVVQELKAVIPSLMPSHHVPGVAVALISGGETVWAEGFGWANRDRQLAVTPDTLFQAASISKPVSAWVAMTLVDQGRHAAAASEPYRRPVSARL